MFNEWLNNGNNKSHPYGAIYAYACICVFLFLIYKPTTVRDVFTLLYTQIELVSGIA